MFHHLEGVLMAIESRRGHEDLRVCPFPLLALDSIVLHIIRLGKLKYYKDKISAINNIDIKTKADKSPII